MKNTKKLLALLLALVMAMTAFAACSKNEDGDKDEKAKTEETGKAEEAKNEEEEAENGEEAEVKAAMKTFCDGYEEMDVEKMLAVVDENATAYEKIQSLTAAYDKFAEVAQQMQEALGEGGTEIAQMMIDMVEAKAEVKDIKVDGEKANVKLELSVSDLSTFVEDFKTAYTEVLTGMLTEEVMAQAEGMTEEEQFELGMQYGLMAAKEVLSSYEPEILTQSGTMVLEKIDGEWMIVDTEA